MVIAEYDLDGNCVNNYIFAGNDRIGIMRNPGQNDLLLFLLKDQLGTAKVVVNDSGTVMARYKYYSFGESAGSWVSQGTDYRFTGKEIDEETYYYYFGARYYDPEIGRWFSVDPAGQGFSPYVYCGNNPLIMVDENGQFFWSLLVHAFVGAVVGGGLAEAHGENLWEGFSIGALGGAAIWAGGAMAASKGFLRGWGGLVGKLVSSGGYSMFDDLGHGRGLFESYSYTFGPLTMSFAKGMKSKFGFSYIGALAMAHNWDEGMRLDLKASLKSGSPVFVGDVRSAYSFVPGDPAGICAGDVISVEGTAVKGPLPPDYVVRGFVPENARQWILGHERIHAIQYSLWRHTLPQFNLPFDAGGRFYFNMGSDLGWSGSGLGFSLLGYTGNPYEFFAYLGHNRY